MTEDEFNRLPWWQKALYMLGGLLLVGLLVLWFFVPDFHFQAVAWLFGFKKK